MKPLIKLILFIFICIVGIAIFLFYQFISIPGKVQNELNLQSCNGVIDTIEKTQSCFLTIHVKQKTEMVDLKVMNCCEPIKNVFFEYAQVGDSLIKKKSKFMLTVIKAKTHETKDFSYPYCFH